MVDFDQIWITPCLSGLTTKDPRPQPPTAPHTSSPLFWVSRGYSHRLMKHSQNIRVTHTRTNRHRAQQSNSFSFSGVVGITPDTMSVARIFTAREKQGHKLRYCRFIPTTISAMPSHPLADHVMVCYGICTH